MTTVLEVNYSTYKGVVETTTSVANIVTSGVSQEQSKSDDFIAQQSAGSQKADFLLVIDNSGSMTEEQAIVVQNAELFFEKLLAAGLDFQVGMVATDRATLYEANGKKFFGANDQTDYESAVASVGIYGSGTESGIYWGEQALIDNGTVAQAGFPRKGATLSVLFISDEPDQYTSYTGNYMTPGTSFDFNNNLFLNNNYVAYAMVAIDPVTNSPGAANGTGVNCNSPSTGYAGGTIDYSKLVGLTGGIYGTICQEDYSAVLDKMIDQSASSGSPYILSEVPIPASISVRVNGQNIPLLDSSNSGYLFQKSSNSIVFYGKSIPKQGDAIQVDYKYVPDTTAPQLKSVSPEDGLQDAESETNIVLLFTEDLSNSSVNTSNIKLIDNSTTQEIPGQLSLYGDRVVFNPTDNLTDNTTYLIQVSGVKDTSGNSLVGSLVSSFKTKIPDFTPPQILTISPTDGAIDISPDTRIEITFSEEINSADFSSIQLLDNNSGSQIYPQYQTLGNQAILTPFDNLTDNTTYLIVINGVTDLAGNPLSNPSTTSFTTLNPDRTPPTLTSTFPNDGEINVALDTLIMLTFSEVLESTSLNTTNIQLLDNNTSLQVPAQLTPIENQAILKPADNLTDNTTYILRIEGVTDLAGNLLNGPITTSFHTRNWIHPLPE